MEIGILLTILFGLFILRMFAISMYGLFGKRTTLTDNQKKTINVFWLIVTIITAVLFIQRLI